MARRVLVAGVLLMAGQSVSAQVPPSGGQQLQQIPQAPTAPKIEPEIRIDRNSAPLAAQGAGPKIRANRVRVTGQTKFAESELLKAIDFIPGEYDLGALRMLAAKVTTYYNSRGFILAQAYIPAQQLADGSVTIAVVEGRYGAIRVNNQSKLNDRTATTSLETLKVGDPVEIAPLERRLLLLSDMPGVVVKSTLAPGASVGTSDLIVDVMPGRSISGDIEGDNSGNRYTGAWRLGGGVNFNNPTGHGDVASLRFLTSFSGLYFGRAAYQTRVGDTTVGVALAYIDYKLGKEFRSLDASGNAIVGSIFASHPLIRSRNNNLYVVGAVDLKRFHDDIDTSSTRARKRVAVLNMGLNGDEHDSFGGGGWSIYSISGSVGNLDISSPIEHAIDALTARSDGAYGKVQASFARVQSLSGPLSLYGAVRGQIAFNNLDTSEKMQLGGAYGVRAYPEGETYGDDGYLATVEARLALPQVSSVPGHLQLIGFIDVGAVKYAHNPWFAGSNSAHRSGYGAGINFSGADGWGVRTAYARKLGGQDATSAPDKSGRFWVQLVKLF